MKILQPKEDYKYNIKYQSKEFTLNKTHNTDAGFDIKAYVSSDVVINPGERKLIDTGITITIQLPVELEAQIRPRSGLAIKHGITVLNSPGTIDPGYTGEIKIILINHGIEKFTVRKGDAIAQLVFSKVLDIQMILSTETNIRKTERGKKGFGSSDKKIKTTDDSNSSQ